MPTSFEFIVWALAIGQLSYAAADGPAAGALPSAGAASNTAVSQILVTATTGNHPVFTFVPSQDPQHSTVTEKKTTTDKDHHTVVIFPLGWVWTPIAPPPGIPPPNVPVDLPPPKAPDVPPPKKPDLPKNSDPPKKPEDNKSESEKNCKTSAPPECTQTISYVSGSKGYSQTTLGKCDKPSGCVSGTQVTKTTTIHTQLPYIVDTVPSKQDVIPTAVAADPKVMDYFKQLYLQKKIAVGQTGNKPSCDTKDLAADSNIFKALSEKFCDDVKVDASKELKKDLDSSALGKRALWSRTPPASANSWKDYKFHFEWKPKKGNCVEDCKAAFSTIAGSCGQYAMRAEGSYDVSCGEYNWKITKPPTPPPPPPPPPPPENKDPPPNESPQCISAQPYSWVPKDGYSVTDFESAIQSFCGTKNYQVGLKFGWNPDKQLKSFKGKLKDPHKIGIYAVAWDGVQKGCKKPKKESFDLQKDYQQKCLDNLHEVLKACGNKQPGGDTTLGGGSKIENSDDYGCIEWKMRPV